MTVRLPIDELLPQIRASLKEMRHAVIVSPPGSGKTTRVPPALVEDGSVILLQPRRVAARSLARRIADEQGWKLGGKVGWQIRLDRNFSRDTELLVCTEGILTARLQSDPLLSEFRTVVLDEFHERSVHADLAMALVAQAAEARSDLRIVVMSATIDPRPVIEFLGGSRHCARIESDGALHPVEVRYRSGQSVPQAIGEVLHETEGDILVFLPGMREIEDARRETNVDRDVELAVLHGSLSPAEQDRALVPGSRRKVILSTNIAETSLTVEGVRIVIDGGRHKVVRYDIESGIDRLVTERIPRDAADQRAGRAGRLGPGVAVRLWDERDILDPQREPEIHRVDLTPLILDVLRWGDDPHSFRWFDAPAPERIEAALDLLRSMGAVEVANVPKLNDIGVLIQRLPLPPRIARILVEAKGSKLARRACAALSEGAILIDATTSSASDLLQLADRGDHRRVGRSAEDMRRILRDADVEIEENGSEEDFVRAVLAGYPDRVARRRAEGGDRYRLFNGEGAVLSRRSSVRDEEWVVAVDVRRGGPRAEGLIELASRIDPEWLRPTSTEIVHTYDPEKRRVRAFRTGRYGALSLERTPVPVDRDEAAAILAREMLRTPLNEENQMLLRRMQLAGVEPDMDAIAQAATAGHTTMPELRIADWIDWDDRQRIERDAPSHIEIPSGRRVALDYREDGTVVASAKLQEWFGLEDSPRIGASRVPVTIELLAPNGRPVQLTSDLRGFWEKTYSEVRKELRGRYPKHPWPEDPRSVPATAKTKKQLR